MIYSSDFVWLHFPKCAGAKIEYLFKKYYSNDRKITQDLVDPKKGLTPWHDSIIDRESRDPKFSLGTRTIICSFRKLSSWLESRYNFEYRRSPTLDHRPERLLEGKFLERDGFENHADYYAKKYLSQFILESNTVRFIRTEYFESDFKLIFGEYLDISIIPDREFNGKVNASKSYLPLDIRKRLYQDRQVLYEKCPYWKMVEKIAYDD